MLERISIEKLVHGGQALGTLSDGKRAFVWNALPGEVVSARITKKKRGHIEAAAEEIITTSPDRIMPRDEAYLSTSPWQIMPFDVENNHKQTILAETMQREHVVHQGDIAMVATGEQWHYRNKMEYSFYGDDDGLHLALFNRGSHGKRIITGSSIAMPSIDAAAHKILGVLQSEKIRASQLKTVVIRSNQNGDTVVALFVKDENFPEIKELFQVAQGIVVCFSTPKSPASVLTRELYRSGDITLVDAINNVPIRYDVHSFFQVNVPVFEQALSRIQEFSTAATPIIDMYAGVGTIGIPIAAQQLIEIDAANIAMATRNSEGRDIEIVAAAAERALEYVPDQGTLVLDPPRAGLHAAVTAAILDTLPDQVAYLSCNPITQARDLAILQQSYTITSITGYNFFPRTPHIESLALLTKK